MSAVLSVRLGNSYNISYDAQRYASAILKRVSKERWVYFLKDCLKTDDRILYKLLEDKPRKRWIELVNEFSLGTLATQEVQDRTVRHLLVESESGRGANIEKHASKLIAQLGYTAQAN
jgi:hypothetical protein